MLEAYRKLKSKPKPSAERNLPQGPIDRAVKDFLRARAIARNSYGRPNSVCLSVTASTVSRPGEIETSDFHHMIV